MPEKPFILIALIVLNSGRGFAEYYQHSPGGKKNRFLGKIVDLCRSIPRDA
ncbi:hypothetical protein IQ269_09600 [Tychonema sp. LEGE 07199]|uniref:hypothetical protein n=1 Tax=unclassified Tychonema TaxID=2642144 RepID=UPI0018815320|nr:MULTISPECIES: hypothetical protein [unclassified Tychonema]MBE9121065.1 hypothetical protein [Tychonema sp. LEGE 07199]MBE9133488.1 hypothetical protein [Tychonema sp. LEGE 07196]